MWSLLQWTLKWFEKRKWIFWCHQYESTAHESTRSVEREPPHMKISHPRTGEEGESGLLANSAKLVPSLLLVTSWPTSNRVWPGTLRIWMVNSCITRSLKIMFLLTFKWQWLIRENRWDWKMLPWWVQKRIRCPFKVKSSWRCLGVFDPNISTTEFCLCLASCYTSITFNNRWIDDFFFHSTSVLNLH